MATALCWPRRGEGNPEHSPAVSFIIISAICITCLLAYGPMLGQFFTGTDTITLIETSRINDFQDFWHIVSQPLMAGSDFLRIARFYRPLSTISYSIDYWLWGLNPLGFHLGNLLFHSITCIFIFVMMRSSFNVRPMPAGLGALAFAIHPILIETVPSIDRRHDMIAGLFIVLCVIFCAKYLFLQNQRRRYLWLSVFCQVGAMASKETAFFLPALMFIFMILFCRQQGEESRSTAILNAWSPYVFSAFIYLLWRLYVLGGLGGYADVNHGTWTDKERYIGQMAVSYLYDLLSPVDNMWQPALKTARGIMILGFVITILPLATEILLSWRKRSTKECDFAFALPKIRVFFMCWLLLPLGIYCLTLTFGHRGMYIPTMALACLIGLNFQWTSARIQTTYSHWNGRWFSRKGRPVIETLPKALSIAASIFVVSLMALYSPIVCQYGAWRESAELSSNLLRQFLVSASILPDKSCVFLNQVPDSLANTADGSPQPKEVALPQDYSFTSWLKLYLPRCHSRVILGKRSKAKQFCGFVRLTNCLWTKRTLVVFVSMGRPRDVR